MTSVIMLLEPDADVAPKVQSVRLINDKSSRSNSSNMIPGQRAHPAYHGTE